MLAAALILLTLPAAAQADRCDPGDGQGSMICIDRNGACVEITIDGHQTTPLTDEGVAKRIHAIKHGEDVCWKVDEPVSTAFRAKAKGGGLYPSFVGRIEQLQVNLYPLDDYDPEFDSRLDSLNGIRLEADGDPNGTWHLTTEKPLAPGEYVARFRAMGVDNWDGQAVLLKIDAAAKPAPASGPE
ncbi:MAG TPA: hypothetical protein VFL14_09160 [Xanthomonadales bacterium]|nr:hypothetical protein [Xanthomonadales bacterium]